MSSFFDRFKGRREPTSAQIAKERLKLVLVTDRSDLSPEKLRGLQGEIMEVIKRYIQIDEMEVQIKIEQRDRKNYLVADIPLHRDHAYAHGATDELDSASAATQAERLSAELEQDDKERAEDEAAPGADLDKAFYGPAADDEKPAIADTDDVVPPPADEDEAKPASTDEDDDDPEHK